MRTAGRVRTASLRALAAVTAAAAVTGCGMLGGDDDATMVAEPPAIGGGMLEGPVPRPAETPAVTAIEEMTDADRPVAVMRTPMEDGEYHIGMAASCEEGGPVVTVSMGPFPADYRAVQLAVRTAEGDTERFGPVLRLGVEHGFHSPVLDEQEEIERFLGGALQGGALISNGFYSFFYQAEDADGEAFREVLDNCE